MTVLHLVRRAVLGTAVACIACVAQAEDYPSRPITTIVPFAAGGPTDILGRVVAQAISPMLGQQVIIEDTTGAGGTIGATKAARAAPDGYTMLMGNLGTQAASVGIYSKLAYDPRTDFEPVILVASTPMVLVTRKTLPVHTLAEVRLAEIGADIPPPDQRSPEALGHLVNSEIDKWVPLIKAAGVTE
jgi:tripartite-type tricarboxylate transporter receptor subunit TctC